MKDVMKRERNDWSAKKSIIKDELREYLYEKTKKKADDTADHHGNLD